MSKPGIGLPFRILFGAVAGILTGLLIGEEAAILDYVGDAYVQLLVMCVYPYLLASLLYGFGKLDTKTSLTVFRRSWFFYLIAWGVSIALILPLGFVFPLNTPPRVLIPGDEHLTVNLVSMLIPGNLISSLSSNYVPAVVIGAVFFGLAIQRLNHKETFLEITKQVKDACVIIWNWIVYVAPVGVFALFASLSGTIRPEEIYELLAYIIIYLAGASVLTFLILPYLISAFTNLSPGKILHGIQSGLLLAIVTNLAVVALPLINDMILNLSKEEGIKDDRLPEITGTQISIAYPFAQLGNLFVLFFILFCSFFFQSTFTLSDYITLPVLTLLSTFGSPSSTVNAVQFLSDIYHLPGDPVGIFVSSSAMTRFPQVAVCVMGFVFTALLSTFSFYGKLVFRPSRLLFALVILVLFPLSMVTLSRLVGTNLWQVHTPQYQSFVMPEELTKGIPVFLPDTSLTLASDRSDPAVLMHDIRKSGVLRVGYNDVYIPFCYRNISDKLVGFDVAMMYLLARDMSVGLEFIPYRTAHLIEDLEQKKFDIAIGGLIATPGRLTMANATEPYEISPVAILIRNQLAGEIQTRQDIEKDTGLRIGVYDNELLIHYVKSNFPENSLVEISSYNDILNNPEIDLLFWSLDKAIAFAYAHHGLTAVQPQDLGPPFPLVYYLPKGSDHFTSFLNYWIRLKQIDWKYLQLKDHWIRGNQTNPERPRWSILRDVLKII